MTAYRRTTAQRSRSTPPRQLTTVQKGYGREHRRLREQVRRTVEAGIAVCWRCRQWIAPNEAWDLGHRDDHPGAKRLGLYGGPEHRSCSRTAGGWKRQGITNAPPPRRATSPAKALKSSSTPAPNPATQHDSRAMIHQFKPVAPQRV